MSGGIGPDGIHANISTPKPPQGQYGTTTPGPSSSNIGIIVAGVLVPLVLITLGCLLIYAWYRKKYPVRMVIGKDFTRFTNPAYNKRASTLTLVREDANVHLDDPTAMGNEGHVNKALSLIREDDIDDVYKETVSQLEVVNEATETDNNTDTDKNENIGSSERKNKIESHETNIARERPKRALLIKADDFEEKDFDMVTESDLGQRTESEVSSGNDSTDTHTISLSFTETFDNRSTRSVSTPERLEQSSETTAPVEIQDTVHVGGEEDKAKASSESDRVSEIVEPEMEHLSKTEDSVKAPAVSERTSERQESVVIDVASPYYNTEEIAKASQFELDSGQLSDPAIEDANTKSECSAERQLAENDQRVDIESNLEINDHAVDGAVSNKTAKSSEELQNETVSDVTEIHDASFQNPSFHTNEQDDSYNQTLVNENKRESKPDISDTKSDTENDDHTPYMVRIEEEILTETEDIITSDQNISDQLVDENIDSVHISTGNDPEKEVDNNSSTGEPTLNLADLSSDCTDTESTPINSAVNKRQSLTLSTENIYLENSPPSPVLLVQDSIILESDVCSPVHLDSGALVQNRERRAHTLDENMHRNDVPMFINKGRARHSFDDYNAQQPSVLDDFIKYPTATGESSGDNTLPNFSSKELSTDEAMQKHEDSIEQKNTCLNVDINGDGQIIENESVSELITITNQEQNENKLAITHSTTEDCPSESTELELLQQGLFENTERENAIDVQLLDIGHADKDIPNSHLVSNDDLVTQYATSESTNVPVFGAVDILIPKQDDVSDKLSMIPDTCTSAVVEPSELTPSSDSSETMSFELIGEDNTSHKSSDMQSNISVSSSTDDLKTPQPVVNNALTKIKVGPFNFDFDEPASPDLSEIRINFDEDSIENIREDQDENSSQLEESLGSLETGVTEKDWDVVVNEEESNA